MTKRFESPETMSPSNRKKFEMRKSLILRKML